MKKSCTDSTFGIEVASDDLSKRVHIRTVVPNKNASKLFSSLRATRNKIQGAYIVKIDDNRIFSQQDAIAALRQLYDNGRDEFSITFAPERKLNAKTLRKAVNEYILFAPNTKTDNDAELQSNYLDGIYLQPIEAKSLLILHPSLHTVPSDIGSSTHKQNSELFSIQYYYDAMSTIQLI